MAHFDPLMWVIENPATGLLKTRPFLERLNPRQDVAPIGAARQEDSLLESQMQLGSLQYLHNPMKGASEHFHFLSVLAGTYDDTVRNIDIGRVGYLRHSFIAGFPTERVPKMPLSGVSTRSGDSPSRAWTAR